MSPIVELGFRIDAVLPAVTRGRLNPGRGDVNLGIPGDVMELYRWHDGERDFDIFDPIFGFELLPLEECMSETNKLRGLHPSSGPIGVSWVIGRGYATSLVLAIPVRPNVSRIGYFFIDEGTCVSAHDSILSLLQATEATWVALSQPAGQKQAVDFDEISRRFSNSVGEELWSLGPDG